MVNALVSETRGQAPYQTDSPEISGTLLDCLEAVFNHWWAVLKEKTKQATSDVVPQAETKQHHDVRPGKSLTGEPMPKPTTYLTPCFPGTKATGQPTPKHWPRRQKSKMYRASCIIPNGKDFQEDPSSTHHGAGSHAVLG
ncbi:Hypothetical predicted protein [Pelobates cultripes]|uniref:Uncharacterized protein n=1 Tax=Pelobates cultripes TaxID=61616 RepID=A0AAD1RWL5_PELCU|nr:Hypothetical predicted protein [Pelobates cultripes]